MKIDRAIAYFLSLVVLSSCEQFLEVELPGQEPRLVLNALLEPTDTLKVYLTKSKGILEPRDFDQFDVVSDANVFLKTQDGQQLPMAFLDRSRPFEPNAFYYVSGHQFQEDQTYEIIAEHSLYPSIRTAQKLPTDIPIKSIDLVNLGPRSDFEGENEFQVTVTFDDPSGKNFYEISGFSLGSQIVVSEGDTTYFFYQSDLYPDPVNPAYEKDYLMRDVLLFNDVLLNGIDSQIVFRTHIRSDVDMELTIRFSHVSESYYRYQDTADLQRYNSGDFLSQPVLVFNNVTNGFGIFKSRNTDQRVIQIRQGDQ